MHIVLLGTAAGGGFPQWNCWCDVCRVARTEPKRAHPRTQSSLAVSSDGERWFLCNASPDVHRQVAQLSHQTEAKRFSPIEGVLLTDAELDHTLGLVLLREANRLDVYAAEDALAVLECDTNLFPTIRAFADVRTIALSRGAVELRYRDGSLSGLTVSMLPVSAGAPRFARGERAAPGRVHACALVITDAKGARMAYVPGCGAVDDQLAAVFNSCRVLFYDGTFYSADELGVVRGAHEGDVTRDHLPMSDDGGSLAWLSRLETPRKVYVHINNTNPVLIEDSVERAAVTAAGMIVGDDGMRFTI